MVISGFIASNSTSWRIALIHTSGTLCTRSSILAFLLPLIPRNMMRLIAPAKRCTGQHLELEAQGTEHIVFPCASGLINFSMYQYTVGLRISASNPILNYTSKRHLVTMSSFIPLTPSRRLLPAAPTPSRLRLFRFKDQTDSIIAPAHHDGTLFAQSRSEDGPLVPFVFPNQRTRTRIPRS